MRRTILRPIFPFLAAIDLACAANTQYKGGACQPLSSRQAPDTTVYDTTQVTTRAEIVSGPALRYPEGARDAGIQGSVVLSFVVDQQGRVEATSIEVLQRVDPSLDRAAVQYITKASFQPACISGAPVRVRDQTHIDYKVVRR